MALEPLSRPRGRPRAFDEAAVLDCAIDLFCQHGYAAVAISDLTAATGLTVGSLYKAYKDKDGIFLRALERYVMLREIEIDAIVHSSQPARTRIAALLRLYAGLSQGHAGQLGCMVVAGITEIDQGAPPSHVLRGIVARRRDTLASLLLQGQQDGSLGKDRVPQASADVLLALLQGMRVIGRIGAFPADTDAFVEHALHLIA